MFKIYNRRYIGSKTKLLNFIHSALSKHTQLNKGVFLDLFSGTGVVADFFSKRGFDCIVNDSLYSNFVIYNCFFSNEEYSQIKIEKIIQEFNALDYSFLKENYFSNIYGNKYYSIENAKLIGFIRDDIEKMYFKKSINLKEKYILLTSLLFSADKIANTVGHFEHYLKTSPSKKRIFIDIPEINKNTQEFKIFNEDANVLSKKIVSDICYIDPPYNSRQYINFYHVLENLAQWKKPTEFEGKSMKFKRNELKSGYSRKSAPKLLKELIDSINAKWIVISYNNTYNANSTASNNIIKLEEIKNMLEKKGELIIEEVNYKHFNSGKTNFSNHKEMLFICKVKNEII
jgi:adenine-specific DNA-methyltransferase